MLIIGDRINSTRKRIGEAVRAADADFIREEARKQVAAGADMLDVNGGIAGHEPEYLCWLVNIVQEVADVPLCLDSADAGALGQALPLCRKQPMINSITEERARLDTLAPLARDCRAKVIALCLPESGTPAGLADRVATALRLVDRLTSEGIPAGDIYVDPCVFPVSTGSQHGPAVLEAVTQIRLRNPEVHISCGVSNVSFGLPARKLLNEVFLMMLMSRGLDTAIIDPCQEGLLARIKAAEALGGQDKYCTHYLQAYRSGLLEPPRG
jgi:5-methyltetrahydrofolate--homocysteine methyltransferase